MKRLFLISASVGLAVLSDGVARSDGPGISPLRARTSHSSAVVPSAPSCGPWAPQDTGAADVSVLAPPIRPHHAPGDLHPHTPCSHTLPLVHLLSQPLQWLGSEEKSRQTPAQVPQVAGHTQVPFTHCLPAVQVFPQPPQWLSSLRKSTQIPPQIAPFDGHAHVPWLHTLPPLQTLPHAPQ